MSLQSAACGSESPADANSGVTSNQSSAGSGSTAPASTAKTGSSTPSSAAGAGASSSAKPAANSGGSNATGKPASTAVAGSGNAEAPAAGSGSANNAPKGDVTNETAGAGGTKSREGAAGSTSSMGTAGSTGAAGGMSAAAGSAGSAGGAATQPGEDYGKGDGTDVVTIGDSWMSIATNGGGIEGGLDRAGTKYRHYSVAGTTLLTGQIPGQYDQAKAVNPNIKTIIMTGGGNDVMFSGGCNTKEACTQFSQRIADGLDELWMRAEKDGVTAAVYIQYSRNAGTAPADTRPDMPAVPKICSNGKFRCVFIGTTDLIAATDTVDGIHPTLDGCDRIAKRTLEEMDKAGIRR